MSSDNQYQRRIKARFGKLVYMLQGDKRDYQQILEREAQRRRMRVALRMSAVRDRPHTTRRMARKFKQQSINVLAYGV